MFIQTLRHVVRGSILGRMKPILAKFKGISTQTQSQRPKASKPLRILFCGSDEFSSASLRALHAEQQNEPKSILSIDVLCRPGKLAGRGLKTVKHPPIKAVAEELGLTVHERDTFTGWELPKPSDEPINLIIAVSFGLFVPPRILNSVEYGGLNVHPSLLPSFRGPAPLQHTILSGKKYCGVTLQTLDEKSFDHGIILAQTTQSGTKVPKGRFTYAELLDHVTPMAAKMLVRGIKEKLFVPPLVPAGWYSTSKRLIPAPKVTPADREVNWHADSASYIDSIDRALGRPWNIVRTSAATTKRFIYEGIEDVALPKAIEEWYVKQRKTNISTSSPEIPADPPLRFMVTKTPKNLANAQLFVEDGDAIIIATCDRRAIRVKEITLEGEAKKSASKVMRTIDERREWILLRDSKRYMTVKRRAASVKNMKNKATGPSI